MFTRTRNREFYHYAHYYEPLKPAVDHLLKVLIFSEINLPISISLKPQILRQQTSQLKQEMSVDEEQILEEDTSPSQSQVPYSKCSEKLILEISCSNDNQSYAKKIMEIMIHAGITVTFRDNQSQLNLFVEISEDNFGKFEIFNGTSLKNYSSFLKFVKYNEASFDNILKIQMAPTFTPC